MFRMVSHWLGVVASFPVFLRLRSLATFLLFPVVPGFGRVSKTPFHFDGWWTGNASPGWTGIASPVFCAGALGSFHSLVVVQSLSMAFQGCVGCPPGTRRQRQEVLGRASRTSGLLNGRVTHSPGESPGLLFSISSTRQAHWEDSVAPAPLLKVVDGRSMSEWCRVACHDEPCEAGVAPRIKSGVTTLRRAPDLKPCLSQSRSH